jgi:hypothetical protein
MRKLVVAGLAVLGVLAVAGIAMAANTYTATSSISPSKTGSSSKATPVSAALTFTVGESTGARPSPLKTYSIGLGPGIVPVTKVARGCNSVQAQSQILPAICAKAASKGGALVGGGSVNALAGPSNDPSQKLNCFLTVRLVNSTVKNHMWIRIDGVTTGPPGKTCVTAQHSSIDSTFVKTGTASAAGASAAASKPKLPVYAIKFTVPAALLHPIPGFDVAVVHNVSNISKVSKTFKVGKRRVTNGYLQSIGCPATPKGKRAAVVTFTAENGQIVTAQSTSKCAK